jgi:hypothetical protein
LRERFDCSLDYADAFGLAFSQQCIQLLPGKLAGGNFAEGILSDIAKRLAPIFKGLPKRAFAGPIANKPLVVFQLNVVTENLNFGEKAGAMAQTRTFCRFFGHSDGRAALQRTMRST